MKFSVARRFDGLIEIITPRITQDPIVAKYRLKTDTNPFGLFATTVMESSYGLISPEVADRHHPLTAGDNIRFVFKPSSFSLSDTAAFWLKVVAVDAANAEMVSPAPSLPTLVHPVGNGLNEGAFNATAPIGAAITDAVAIHLGRSVHNLTIRNLDGARALHVAYDVAGQESIIPFGTEATALSGTSHTLYLRGIGGTVAFSVRFSNTASR